MVVVKSCDDLILAMVKILADYIDAELWDVWVRVTGWDNINLEEIRDDGNTWLEDLAYEMTLNDDDDDNDGIREAMDKFYEAA